MANDFYNGYNYEPSSVSGWDKLSDIFLGTNIEQTKNQNSLNWELLKEQNKFNEYMSNTAYQRAMKDMEKAGINPMLVANLGGASSPTMSQPIQQAPSTQGQIGNKILEAIKKERREKSELLVKLASVLL